MDVKAPESTYLLFAEPFLNDKGPTVASAIQSIVLYLQSLNIPVLRFHPDRAAQLMLRQLAQWLHGQAIRISTSSPGVPQENGAAECAVKEVKLTTRKTLASSTLDKTFWPVAAKAAASMQKARVMRQVPRMATAFGAKVLVKKRRYAASGALIRLEFDESWDDGIHLGLSDQVSDGHLVYVDGVFTRTKNVRTRPSWRMLENIEMKAVRTLEDRWVLSLKNPVLQWQEGGLLASQLPEWLCLKVTEMFTTMTW